MKIKRNNNKGISLIVLVISIIVMIILAGAIIISVNNTGVLSSADKAKLDTEIANEKEILNFCVVNAKVKDENRELKLDKLNEELVSYSAQAYMEVATIIVQFNKSGRYYEIDANGKAEHVQASGLKTLTLVCKKTDGTVIDTKEYTIIKDKYSIELPVIEGYEPIDMVATGEITESTTVEIPYYVIFDDDTELVFTGLDSAGKVTTVENDIVSYKLGGESGTYGNALKDKASQGIVKVPNTYKNKPVDQIGQYAFRNCSNIRNVELGNNIKIIKLESFVGTNIKKIVIGEKVESIGVNAFSGCAKLEEVTLGKSLKSIGGNAFSNCTMLKTVVVKTQVEGTIRNQFAGCINFINIKTDESNPIYKVEDNILYSKDGKSIFLIPTGRGGNLNIKQGVETIHYRAVATNAYLQEITFPDSVKTIGMESFSGSNIKKVVIGEKVESIGGNAFSGCNKLKEVGIDSTTIAKSLTAQMSCGQLINVATTIYIKEGITEIGSYVVDNFDVADTDKEGYVKYVKKTT